MTRWRFIASCSSMMMNSGAARRRVAIPSDMCPKSKASCANSMMRNILNYMAAPIRPPSAPNTRPRSSSPSRRASRPGAVIGSAISNAPHPRFRVNSDAVLARQVRLRQAQPLPDNRRQAGLGERVEEQARQAVRQQVATQVGDHIEAKGADRSAIIAETLQLLADPARDLGAASVRKARQLGKAGDRHHTRNDRHLNAERCRIIDKMIIAAGVEEVLRDRRARAGVDLAPEAREVVCGTLRLRVILGVTGDIDMKPVIAGSSNELDQFARVAKLTRVGAAGRQVAAQGDEVADTVLAVGRERLPDTFPGRADA